MTKEFHQWVSEMANTIEDASTVYPEKSKELQSIREWRQQVWDSTSDGSCIRQRYLDYQALLACGLTHSHMIDGMTGGWDAYENFIKKTLESLGITL